MSITSSAASTRDVTFQGEEVTLEAALVEVTNALRSAINLLQTNLTALANLEEQSTDEDSDFREAVQLEDSVIECLDLFASHSRDLKKISAELRGKPPTHLVQWYAGHKAALASEKANAKKAASTAMEC